MGAIAEWLLLTLTARTPKISLVLGDVDGIGGIGSSERFIHFSAPEVVVLFMDSYRYVFGTFPSAKASPEEHDIVYSLPERINYERCCDAFQIEFRSVLFKTDLVKGQSHAVTMPLGSSLEWFAAESRCGVESSRADHGKTQDADPG